MNDFFPCNTPTLKFGYIHDLPESVLIPYFKATAQCGFPSPADEYLEERLDIKKFLVKNDLSTFYVHARGDSMTDAFISDGALLIVDRSVPHRRSSKFLCFYDNGFTVKFVNQRKDATYLLSAKTDIAPIELKEGTPFYIWGTVTFSINIHYKW
jgi:DNA polymerase V